jgi:hypothetical protein
MGLAEGQKVSERCHSEDWGETEARRKEDGHRDWHDLNGSSYSTVPTPSRLVFFDEDLDFLRLAFSWIPPSH